MVAAIVYLNPDDTGEVVTAYDLVLSHVYAIKYFVFIDIRVCIHCF